MSQILRKQIQRRKSLVGGAGHVGGGGLIVAHKKIAIFLDWWNKKNFRTEGELVGGWAPLKAGGRRVKLKGSIILDESAKLLQDHGDLRRSMNPFHSRRDAGISSGLFYSRPHHKGEGHLPERRLLPKYKEVKKDIRKIMRNHIKGALK